MHKPILLALLVLLTGCQRGTWWYRHGSTDPYGVQTVLIDGTGSLTPIQLADELEACQVTRVYASYGPLSDVSAGPTTASDLIAAYNVELHSRGIATEVLISEGWDEVSDTIVLQDWSSLLDRIEDRILAFNDVYGADPDATFDAIHLDIEPQTSPLCKLVDPDPLDAFSPDPAACHALFAAFPPMLADIVDLEQQYRRELPIFLDLPVWVDDWSDDPLQPTKIGWPTPAETSRAQWFADVAAVSDGLTLMAYGEDDAMDLWDSVSWEVASHPDPVRVGLDYEPSGTFASWSAMGLMTLWLEWVHGVDVDLHDQNDLQADGGCH